MYLEICRNLEINAVKYIFDTEFDTAHFFLCTWISMASMFKKLELLTDIDVLSMIEKGIRGRICHVIYR